MQVRRIERVAPKCDAKELVLEIGVMLAALDRDLQRCDEERRCQHKRVDDHADAIVGDVLDEFSIEIAMLRGVDLAMQLVVVDDDRHLLFYSLNGK